MIGLLRKFAINTLLKWRWRNNRQSLARTLGKFADVEADSAWHYTAAADLLDQPAHRAVMVLAAVEETHHAYLLRREAGESACRSGGISRKRILGSAADLLDFLAYSHVAERHIHREFGSIADSSADEDVKAVIRSISSDEEAHEQDASLLLRQLAPEAQFRRSLRSARQKRAFDNWMELVHSLGRVNAAVWLSLIYLALGWIAASSCRRRMNPAEVDRAGSTPWPVERVSLLAKQSGIRS